MKINVYNWQQLLKTLQGMQSNNQNNKTMLIEVEHSNDEKNLSIISELKITNLDRQTLGAVDSIIIYNGESQFIIKGVTQDYAIKYKITEKIIDERNNLFLIVYRE